MILSTQSATMLVDMLENRISGMEVTDRDDMRELLGLKRCLAEVSLAAGTIGIREFEIDSDMPRRGRRRKMLMHA